MPTMTADYEDSKCNFFAGETASDSELLRSDNNWYYNEICLSSKRVGSDCPNRLYVFERIPGYRLEGLTDKELSGVSNRSECQDHCLNAPADAPCRSLSFDSSTNKCLLHRETRYMTPQGFKQDASFDYMENMCLNRKFTKNDKLRKSVCYFLIGQAIKCVFRHHSSSSQTRRWKDFMKEISWPRETSMSVHPFVQTASKRRAFTAVHSCSMMQDSLVFSTTKTHSSMEKLGKTLVQ